MHNSRARKHLSWFLILCLGLYCATASFSAEKDEKFKIDLTKLVQETQKMSQNVDSMQLVWWVPTIFWEESLASDPTVSKADATEIIDALDDYVVVAVIDGTIGAYGNTNYKSYSSIKENLFVIDKNQKKYAPLSDSEISAKASEILAMIKPVMANMLGNMGQNLHFFFFPKKDSSGALIDDPKSGGSFAVAIFQNEYRWKLPLISLFPDIKCEKCSESCSGVWNYCPWCGAKLPK